MSTDDRGEYDTPQVMQRPVMAPQNKALVMILHNVVLQLESFTRVLLDVTKTIQLSPTPVTQGQAEKIATVLDDTSGAVRSGAQGVRDSIAQEG